MLVLKDILRRSQEYIHTSRRCKYDNNSLLSNTSVHHTLIISVIYLGVLYCGLLECVPWTVLCDLGPGMKFTMTIKDDCYNLENSKISD